MYSPSWIQTTRDVDQCYYTDVSRVDDNLLNGRTMIAIFTAANEVCEGHVFTGACLSTGRVSMLVGVCIQWEEVSAFKGGL